MIPDVAYVDADERADLAASEEARAAYVHRVRAAREAAGLPVEEWTRPAIDAALARAVLAGVSYDEVEELLHHLAADGECRHPGWLATARGLNRARVNLVRHRHTAGLRCGVDGCDRCPPNAVVTYTETHAWTPATEARAASLLRLVTAPWRDNHLDDPATGATG